MYDSSESIKQNEDDAENHPTMNSIPSDIDSQLTADPPIISTVSDVH